MTIARIGVGAFGDRFIPRQPGRAGQAIGVRLLATLTAARRIGRSPLPARFDCRRPLGATAERGPDLGTFSCTL